MNLQEYRQASDDPGNFGDTFWNLDSGYHLGLLEEAIERIEHLEAETVRLRSELKAIEQLADPLGPSPGDLIRLLGRMAHKALQ